MTPTPRQVHKAAAAASQPERSGGIVDPQGKPARTPDDTKCPSCRSMRRRLSGGFGEVHDICADCGHDFHGERTADE